MANPRLMTREVATDNPRLTIFGLAWVKLCRSDLHVRPLLLSLGRSLRLLVLARKKIQLKSLEVFITIKCTSF